MSRLKRHGELPTSDSVLSSGVTELLETVEVGRPTNRQDFLELSMRGKFNPNKFFPEKWHVSTSKMSEDGPQESFLAIRREKHKCHPPSEA
jgi:hypothetical protein